LGGGATDRKKAKKRHLTEGMTEETLTDLTVLVIAVVRLTVVVVVVSIKNQIREEE